MDELKPGPRKIPLVLMIGLLLVWMAQIVQVFAETGLIDPSPVIGAILAVILIVMEFRYKPPEPWVGSSKPEE